MNIHNDTGLLTWQQFENRLLTLGNKAVAVWGWGAFEQHGPRMVLSTDNIITDHLVGKIAESRKNAVVFPTMPIGMSIHHTAFPGTVSLSQELSVQLAMNMLREFHRMRFRKVFAVLGHGGNMVPFRAAVTLINKELPDLKVADPLEEIWQCTAGPIADLYDSIGAGNERSHAAAVEASKLFAILQIAGLDDEADDLQKITISDDMITYGTHGQGTQGADPKAFRKLFPYGSKGDQRLVDLEKGRQLLSLFVEELLRQFDELAAA